MDATTIDQEFSQLQTEFQDVAKTVQELATKLQAAEQAGDKNATEWLGDLKRVAQDIDDEQTQVKKLLLAVHEFVGAAAQAHQAAAEAADKPPLYAPGHEPAQTEDPQQAAPQHRGLLSGWFGGGGAGMMGGGYGGYYGNYYGGSFGQAMAAGMAMNLGANLVSSIFH
jgi:hypothetical protein